MKSTAPVSSRMASVATTASTKTTLPGGRLRAAFPDLKVAVERTVAEGDLVAVHWSSSGTNSVKTESFPGNGKTVAIDGMTFFRFKDGRIVEEWTTYDNLSLMKQLGMLPAQ